MKSNESDRRACRRRCWKIPFFIAAVVLIKSALVMVLWNALIPDLFHGPALDYPQALGLTVLARLLVGFGGPRGHGGWHRRHHWGRFSPEEKARMREALRRTDVD
jgi:hypothetical protein